MTLKNNLYTISGMRRDGETTHFSLSLNASHVIYRAHFPEEPVTPGVCLVQMAGELLEESLGRNLQLKKVVNAKFLSVVSPLSTTSVCFSLSSTPADAQGCIRSSLRVEYEGCILAKMSLIHTLNRS